MIKKEQFVAVLFLELFFLELFRLSFGVRVTFSFFKFSIFPFFHFFLVIIANINLGIVHNGIDEIMVAGIYIA